MSQDRPPFMTQPMTILGLLCCEPWRLDSANECQMIFHHDGTGEIILRHEFRAWIAAETEWKCLEAVPPLDQNLTATANEDDDDDDPAEEGVQTDIIADISLEITITQRAITTRGPTDDLFLNGFWLKDEAFTPETYSARLEKGSFNTTMDVKLNAIPRWASKYAYRLVFDRSPYPQVDEWKEVDEDDQCLLPNPFLPYSEWNEFCSVKLQDKTQKSKE